MLSREARSLMVLGGALAALACVQLDRSSIIPQWLLEGCLYNGGETGARALLGTVAASTIGVAGTVFSITIAALSLAAGQMGPRLLRNFTRDRGVQFTLGAFLGTYALIVLRSVLTRSEGEFVPHLSLSLAIFFAFVCIAIRWSFRKGEDRCCAEGCGMFKLSDHLMVISRKELSWTQS